MTGTKNQGLTALLAGALVAFTGCVMEPDTELGNNGNELAGVASPPPTDPCNAPFSYNSDLTIALPRIMDTRANPSSLPDTGWYTTAIIQNTSSNLATVRLRALAKPGAAYSGGCAIFSLGSGEAVTFRPDNPGSWGTVGIPAVATGNFEGSMLMETNEPLTAEVHLANTQVGAMGKASGTASAHYVGLPLKWWAAETGTDLVYPTMKSGFNGSSTTLFVQNVDLFDGAVDLVVQANGPSLSPPYGSEYRASVWIPAGRSVAIDPSQFRDSANNSMPAGCSGGANPGQPGARCFGSVRIEPDYLDFRPQVAAIAVEHPASGSVPAILANHFESAWYAADRVWLPVIKNQYPPPPPPPPAPQPPPAPPPASSGIAIMNLSDSHEDITVIIREKAVPLVEYRHTFEDVPPFQSVVASPFAGTFGGFPAGKIGVAEVQSTGPIASAVNETSSVSLSSHHGRRVPGDLATPLIKVDWFGRKTTVTLWNVGGQAVQIVGRYKCRTATGTSYSTHTLSMTAAANVAVDFAPTNIAPGNLCSAIFSTAQDTLVGAVTEESITTPFRDTAIYEAIVLD